MQAIYRTIPIRVNTYRNILVYPLTRTDMLLYCTQFNHFLSQEHNIMTRDNDIIDDARALISDAMNGELRTDKWAARCEAFMESTTPIKRWFTGENSRTIGEYLREDKRWVDLGLDSIAMDLTREAAWDDVKALPMESNCGDSCLTVLSMLLHFPESCLNPAVDPRKNTTLAEYVIEQCCILCNG